MKLSATAKILIALAIFIAAGVLHIAFNITGILGRGGEMRWVNTGRGVSYAMDSAPVFHGHESPFFYIATRDGVRYVSSATGESRVHHPLNLRRPVMRGSGEFAAVSEGERGRAVHLFNSSGHVMTETFDHPIHTFSVNGTGFLSVILQLDDGYHINVFHRNSTYSPLYRNLFHESTHPNIIPMMTEVSDDGRVIAIGLLDYNSRMESKIQFSFTSETDAWGTDGVFFEESLQNQLLLSMRMTTSNRLAVLTDTQIIVYTMDGTSVTKTAEIPLYNRVDQIAFDREGRFAIALGVVEPAFLNAPEAEALGTIHLFDANGTRTGTYRADRRVTHLSMGHGLAIVGTDRNFHAVNMQGGREWEFIALQDTPDFLFLDNAETVMIAGANRADIWQRRRNRDGEAGDFFGIQGQ
ncbi:MAG: DUF5711 family protein [Defluviitaleaceae bacterium]|nr:DUF5711 family protein [Defluviitaleaceae bacterium]